MKAARGFTLIEMLVYIALLGILMTGALLVTFELIQSASSLDQKTTSQDEANFVLRKIDWALTGLDTANPPTVTGAICAQTLTIYKVSYASNPIVIRINGGVIQMKEGSAGALPLTTTNTSVTCLSFGIIAAAGTGPSGIIATTTINGTTFVTRKYFRK